MKKDLFITEKGNFTGRFFYEEGEDRIAKLEFKYTVEEFDREDKSINIFEAEDRIDAMILKNMFTNLSDTYFRFIVLEDENLNIEINNGDNVLVKYDYKYGWIIKRSYKSNDNKLTVESRTLPVTFIPYKESILISYILELLQLKDIMIWGVTNSNVTCNLVGYLHMFFKHHEPKQSISVNTGLNITLENKDNYTSTINFFPMKGENADPSKFHIRLKREDDDYYINTYTLGEGYKEIAHMNSNSFDSTIRFIRSMLAYFGYGLDDLDIGAITDGLLIRNSEKEYLTYSILGNLYYLELDDISYVQDMIPIIQCNY